MAKQNTTQKAKAVKKPTEKPSFTAKAEEQLKEKHNADIADLVLSGSQTENIEGLPTLCGSLPENPGPEVNPLEEKGTGIEAGAPVFDNDALKERIEEIDSDTELSDDDVHQTKKDTSEDEIMAPMSQEEVSDDISFLAPWEDLVLQMETMLKVMDSKRSKYAERTDGKHINPLNLAMNHQQFALNSLKRFLEDTE